MRTFLISHLTRLVDFLKASESAHSDAAVQTAVSENIDAISAPPALAHGDGLEQTKPAVFFPDKPAVRDYLDFHSYAATLADLIDNTQTPLTVGVFGAWGSGKTTLMGMIESALRDTETNSNARRFMLVRFEAWKYYKEDALWRAMLLRVLDALRPNIEGKSKLKESIDALEQSLYRNVEWKEKGGLTIDWPKLAKASASGALKLTFAFVPGVSTVVEAVKAAQGAVGKGDVAGDVSSIAEAFQRDMIVHHRTQLNSIEQFQNEFSKLVKTHFADQRLVIFVDDLDRCLPEKAIEVLEAIKLFLDVEGCVFVLGIDQEVITRGLEARYKEITVNGQSPKFSTHYIEKLIQLPFHLPPIETREIGSYLTSLNVDWPHEDCSQVFAEALSPNPRQIKRTINVFMLLWKLAERRRSSLGEAVTALRLAKVVILQTAYPMIFDHLKSDGRLLQELERLSCETEPTATDQSVDPILLEAVKQTSLKKLFQLLPDDESANFAGLALDELTAFFSLARRAPLASERLATEPIGAPVITHETGVAPSLGRLFQLRAPVRDFVGRAQQLSEVIEAFHKDVSIAVVTGMAGTGKTEFALKLAELLRADYPDGQVVVDMQGTNAKPCDPAEALSACIRSFTGRQRDLPTDVEELGHIYRSYLIDKRVLVLLDNAASAAQVKPLLPPRGSSLLITSRQTLVLPGMVSVVLDQLERHEALALLQSISPRVPSDVAAEICSLCGYLPPAVRAAASTLAVTPDLDPGTFAKQLSDEQKRIELLGTEGVNVTLEASFSMSYSRLSEDAASVFRKLSIFPDTFDAQAEEAICEDPDHSHLSELVRLSLVYYDPNQGRYRVHSLMRLFAQRRLQPDESEFIARKHADFYLEVVKRAGALYRQAGDSSIAGLSLFNLERDNINAGFNWSAVHSSSDPQARSLCSNYAKFAAEILELREFPRVRVEWFVPALEAARQLGDTRSELVHQVNLGGAYRKLEDFEKAITIYAEALTLADELGLAERKAEILSSLGLLYRDRGEIKLAKKYFEDQLTIARELNNERVMSVAFVNLANTELITGETDEALRNYREAIATGRRIGDLQVQAMALGNLGRAYIQRGDPDSAEGFCRQQLEISQKLGDRLSEASAHFNLALALQQKGELEQARAEATIAIEIYRQLESSSNVKRVEDWLAKLKA